jgi:hypothetical protein
MKTILILIGITVLVMIIKSFIFPGQGAEQDTSRPTADKKPNEEKSNDKLVIVNSANYDDLKKALTEFCNMYNKDKFQAIPRLTKLTENEFAITFPHDIDFEIYCYFINYILYPMDIYWKPNVVAWTTTQSSDTWITEKTANKKVMLFIPEDDTEHDVVFMTTEDNIGYKLGFSVGERKQLDNPKRNYNAPKFDINSLTSKQSENFQ